MTTMAKKVGGPKIFMGLLIGGGAFLGGGTVKVGSVIKKKITEKTQQKKREAEAAIVYRVKTQGYSNEGLLFNVGDKYRVLEIAGDAALIEKVGDSNNPYFVSVQFLRSISDYQ